MRDHQGMFNVASDLNFARGILLLDDCDGTCNYEKSGTGADYVVDYNSAAAFIGTNGLRLQTRSTDPAQYDIVSAYKKIGLPQSKYLKFRTMCMFPDVSLVQQLAVRIYTDYLTDVWLGELRFTPNTPVMQYVNAAAAATAITEMALKVKDNQWFDMELAIDIAAAEYLSARFNGVEKDMSGLGLYDSDDTTYSTIQLTLEIGSAGAAQATAYFDQLYCGEYARI